ncbi:MAG: LysR family transcriptional regulator [Gammaproteobacteria bacterium]|nr:LysR family transcriptional regulator [Gammaproteobacteria bacterium]
MLLLKNGFGVAVRFTLKQLKYFVAAGEAGSIIRASENIHVSQPSISSAISHLEETFDLQLFVRHHAQGVTLTTAGASLFQATKSFLNHAEQLQSHAGELSDKIFGTIQVGCFMPLAPIVVPELCHQFMQQYRDVQVLVREGNQAELLGLHRHGPHIQP